MTLLIDMLAQVVSQLQQQSRKVVSPRGESARLDLIADGFQFHAEECQIHEMENHSHSLAYP